MAVLVSNSITDQHGRAVAAASVYLYDEFGALVSLSGGNPRTTDAAGAWSATLLTGRYTVIIRKGADFTSRQLDVCQNEVEPATRQRTVIDQNGEPVAGALVWVYEQSGALAASTTGNPRATDSLGRWDADGLDAGTYDLLIKKGDVVIARSLYACDPDADTNYILAEVNDVIATEAGDRLIHQ